MPLPLRSTLFPYTTLFRSFLVLNHADHATTIYRNVFRVPPAHILQVTADGLTKQWCYWSPIDINPIRDRKSTRLNSSHPSISYAVFCLKKKNIQFLLHWDL